MAESVWFVPKPSGGGAAVVFLEAEDLERALRELAESEVPFDTWYETQMRKLFGCDFARLPRVASSERLFAWREVAVEEEKEEPSMHGTNTSLNMLAFSATAHCLAGCAIGEVLGVVIGTALRWGDFATIALAIVLAFFFGYALAMLPLLRSGLALGGRCCLWPSPLTRSLSR